LSAFQFQFVWLHTLPDKGGWELYGIKANGSQVLLATLAPTLGEWLAKRFADLTAKNLAGRVSAVVD
jgi:hypothetical protein